MSNGTIDVKSYQEGLLCALYHDLAFFEETRVVLKPSDFNIASCRLIYEVISWYYDKYDSTMPSIPMILDIVSRHTKKSIDGLSYFNRHESEYFVKVLRLISKSSKENCNIEYYRRETAGYISTVRISNLDATAYSSAEFMAKVASIRDDTDRLYSGSVELVSGLKRVKPRNRRVSGLGIGIRNVDAMINHGLMPKQVGLLVACTGVGKSVFLINICANAVLEGYDALLVTFENPLEMIQSRYQCVLGHIDTKYVGEDATEIPPDVNARLNYILSEDFPYHSNLHVIDSSTGKNDMWSDIEPIIIKWKQAVKAKNGDDSKALLVCLDWVDKINLEGVPNTLKNSTKTELLQRFIEYLGLVARRQNVIIWTAAQGKGEAKFKEVLDINDTQDSRKIHNGADISLGLAPVVPDDREYDPNDVSQGRYMNISVLKIREGSTVDYYVPVYQSPTLKMWNSENDWLIAQRQAKELNYSALYMLGGK